ncbi:hypothetical protein [Clostridium sp.]|uniref:hypothetical protein n=1 Tax=Clostridium sp. TaxID=1506 RepID=UPI002FC93C6B
MILSNTKKWAKEILRCESILEDVNADTKDKEQAQWKIESIMRIYEKDLEKTLELISEIEKLITEMFDKV